MSLYAKHFICEKCDMNFSHRWMTGEPGPTDSICPDCKGGVSIRCRKVRKNLRKLLVAIQEKKISEDNLEWIEVEIDALIRCYVSDPELE